MPGRIRAYAIWLNDVRAKALERARKHGWRSALTFLHCTWDAWYIQHRNKYHVKPKAVCPCCGWKGYAFYPLDLVTWLIHGVVCPNCLCHERHRMLRTYLERNASKLFPETGLVLHFAPEESVQRMLDQRTGLTIISADRDFQAVRNSRGGGGMDSKPTSSLSRSEKNRSMSSSVSMCLNTFSTTEEAFANCSAFSNLEA